MYCTIGYDLEEQEGEAWHLWEKVALDPTSTAADLERAYDRADAARSLRRLHQETCGVCLRIAS
jgi:hypothetical protein